MMKGTFGRLLRGGQMSDEDVVADMETPPGRLAVFCRELDNTTVARRLTLTIDNRSMVFDAANKKIMKLIEMVPDVDGRGKIAAEIVRDYDQLDGQLQLLASLLTDFLSQPGTFDVVSRATPASYPPKMDGFPTSEWRFACDLYGNLPARVVSRTADAADETTEAAPAPVMAEPVPAPAAAPAPAPEPVAVAPAPVPAPAPVKAPEPAMAMAAASAMPGDTDTISSIINALGTTGVGAKADVVDPAPRNDLAIVENFYDSVAKHCDLAMLITEQGDVVQFSDSATGWFDIGPDIAADMKAWVLETAKIMPGCQLVVMRSPILQHQSVIFMTNGALTAFGAFSSHVTGRIFSIANEFVGRRR